MPIYTQEAYPPTPTNEPQDALSEPAPHEHAPEAPLSPAERLNNSPDYLYELCKEKVGSSDYYQKLRQAPGMDQNEAYVRAADALVNDRDVQLDPFERSMLSLSADLGVFIKAGLKLDELRYGGRLSDADFTTMTQIKLNEIIPFNHSIKELISRFPSLSASALAENLTNANVKIFSHYNPHHPKQSHNAHEMSRTQTAYEFDATVNGMRHEKAAEDLLTAAGLDFDYRVSAEEDSQGNDLFIYVNDQWLGYDIKASYNAEARAYQRHKNSRAVWTTLDPEDFRGPTDTDHDSVSISYETAHDHAEAFRARILDAANGNLRENHYQARRRAKRHGRRALHAAHF